MFDTFGAGITQFAAFCFDSLLEECVVELDDIPFGTEVPVEACDIERLLGRRELILDVVQQSPVAGAPPVDALLDVSHEHVV